MSLGEVESKVRATFRFQNLNVQRLGASLVVLDGLVLAGQVTTGQLVTLVHGEEQVALQVHGVVIGGGIRGGSPGLLSLTIKPQPGWDRAAAGDLLVAS